ncbi:OmpA family protein [Flavobacterium macacae]|uniref:Cell envelope biogenesis protein OmpA n=1 Tax=Flavobacterium macacae TaxID=2488993 RepID=A0A3P3WGK1_9FLAO|nr:OmpA family protein [Flavobacterium macacae]RRJ91673.1 cell envelope biogenesis protein OmpA [Flavobacterium macacae]
MKKIYITLSLLAGMSLAAQNKDTEKADKLFLRFEYVDAAAEYQKLVDSGKSDAYVYRQLADSYYNVYNSKEAIKWYAKATESTQDSETYFKYAQMLKAEGKYEEANVQMKKFAGLAPNDQRSVEFMKDPNYLPKLKSQTKLFDEVALGINSGSSDFGAVLTDDNTIYFASSRNKSRKTYGWNEEPFLDLYTATYNANGTFSEPVAVSELNTKFHDGPASVSADGNTIYFASESFKEEDFEKDKKNKLKVGQVYLFKATKDGSKWGNVKALPFNSKDYSASNPSLSKDGKTLYFSSNMPGSLGGNDIWKVAVNSDGSFGTPENMGPKVNTPGNESFPFITEDNVLYFASDGRKGLGGLDVFRIDLSKGSEAENLGEPVNTSKDDFAFSFNKTKNVGFFSSNKTGKDKIYQANPVCHIEIVTLVKDAKTGAVLANSKVSVLDDKKNVIETKVSGADGKVTYNADCNKAFMIQVARDGYESNSFPVAKTNGGVVNVTADLQPIETIVKEDVVVLNDIYFEFNKSNVTKEGAFELDKLVQVLNKYPNMVVMVKGHTDNRGSDSYNMSLSDRRAKSSVQYILSKGIAKARISGKGYGESEPKVDCKENCTEEEHAQNRRSEFIIVKK